MDPRIERRISQENPASSRFVPAQSLDSGFGKTLVCRPCVPIETEKPGIGFTANGRETMTRHRVPRSSVERDERGFTVIELMIVTLIIAILIAIAVPTFAGARQRANDRAAQTLLRHALAAEKIIYTGALQYADDTSGEMTAIEPGFQYDDTMTPVTPGRVAIGLTGSDIVYLSGKSRSGTCFYLVDDAAVGTGYAEDDLCAAADGQAYVTDGW